MFKHSGTQSKRIAGIITPVQESRNYARRGTESVKNTLTGSSTVSDFNFKVKIHTRKCKPTLRQLEVNRENYSAFTAAVSLPALTPLSPGRESPHVFKVTTPQKSKGSTGVISPWETEEEDL